MGVTCSTHGRDEKGVQNFGRITCKKETTRRKIILEWLLRK
jgi:hypothetical protein